MEQNPRLSENSEHLLQDFLAESSAVHQLLEREAISIVVLHKYSHLVRARRQDMLPGRIIGMDLVLAVEP